MPSRRTAKFHARNIMSTRPLYIPLKLLYADDQVAECVSILEGKLQAYHRQLATEQATATATKAANREAVSKERETEKLVKAKLKRSRGVFPHVDRALQDFEKADGASV